MIDLEIFFLENNNLSKAALRKKGASRMDMGNPFSKKYKVFQAKPVLLSSSSVLQCDSFLNKLHDLINHLIINFPIPPDDPFHP